MSFTRSYTCDPLKTIGANSFSWHPLNDFFNLRYRWFVLRNLWCPRYIVFLPCCSWWCHVPSSHIRRALCPLVLYPLKLPYVRELLIVQNNMACNLNESLVYLMSAYFFPHLMFNSGYLIEFVCLKIDFIGIFYNWVYWTWDTKTC